MRWVEAAFVVVVGVAHAGCGPAPAHPEGAATLGQWQGPKEESGEPPTQLPHSAHVPAPAPKPCPSSKGRDFTAEVKRLHRVVACPEGLDPPEDLDSKAIANHCKLVREMMRQHDKGFVSKAEPFLAKLTEEAPEQLVYPFSGGDLVTALTAFPSAKEITTISLELAGDPGIRMGMVKGLDVSLDKLRREAGEVLVNEHYSRSETLKNTQVGTLPGTLSMFLIGLAVHDYEPVELRYFTLLNDGSIRYLSGCDAPWLEGAAMRRKSTWHVPDFAEGFAHSELRFRRVGDPDAPIRVHRHIAANLNNLELSHFRELIRHLEAKGSVSTMVKAASYLLWRDDFSTIRQYLLDNLAIMLSDSTGIPPYYTKKANVEYETYGSFGGAILPAREIHNRAFRALWKSQPRRPLPFRFGYLSKGNRHLLVTRRAPPSE